jgi:hypothetical protein
MRLRRGVGLILLAASLSACGDNNPASLVFVEISPAQPKLGDITTVKFAATDSRGLPAEGIVVDFELQRDVGGVTLAPTQSSTTQGRGEVITQVTASGRVASVVVVARAGDKVAQSPPISFAGSAVSARGITFQCGPVSGEGSGGVNAIMAYGLNRDLIAGVKVHCTAHVADRNGDGISGALVSFVTEAGTIGPTAESLTDVVGNATVLYKTSLPLPEDVLPGKFVHQPQGGTQHIGQPLAPAFMMPWEWRVNPMTGMLPDPACPGGCDEPRRSDPIRPGRINNPRDNLVAMIAVTAGEEAFLDLNNNGVFDPDLGETFEDTTEPFVDSNDNGTWDSGELYIDTNGDGSWTGKNGVYDGSTLIWAQNRLLWTGLPNPYDYQDTAPPNPPQGYIPSLMRIFPTGAITIQHHQSVQVLYRISDPWFNSYAQNSTQDGCRANASDRVIGFPLVFGDQGIKLRYPTTTDVYFRIYDAHDPENPDAVSVTPPADWSVDAVCRMTFSPNEGGVVELGVGSLEGKVH